ncbi:hypothetical protein SAMN05444920_107431 [Nonomuraea solani]|uniref:Uncharacterized protein n=1 Tax=Nonomuraea solani TaxID=1144553 RepID=A0A1H6E461_9ACTN|nr:hypothetical protein [Nonomuraea solani]SEG92033.1 hypothetical protein SAMN05444920_107431 [Nonomuraea solani]
MEIDKTQIRSAATAFDLERGELGRFIAEAAEDLNAIGDFWGDGKEGTAFFKGQGAAGGYEAVTGQIIEGTEVYLDAHHEIASRLRLMADLVQVADWDSVAAILSKLPPADPGQKIWGTG